MSMPHECMSVCKRTFNGKSYWCPVMLTAERSLFDGWVWRQHHVFHSLRTLSKIEAASKSRDLGDDNGSPYFADARHGKPLTEFHKKG